VYPYAELQEAAGGWSEDRKLGSGGSGVVYRGQLASGTPVAIKRLGEEAAAATRGGTAEEAWRTECSLLATTVHPNVVPVLGSSSDGPELLLVYGYMSEGSLEQRLTRSMPGRKPLSAVQRLPILSDVVRGLAHLHSIGIIHRDIKPANLLLDHGLKARIGDFGIARALESGAGSRPGGTRFAGTATGVRSAPGTLVYMAPEYLKGGAPTPRVDAFALGLVVLETLTGRQASLPSTEYEAGTPDAPEGFPNLLELFHEEMDEADGLVRRLDPHAATDAGAWDELLPQVRFLHAIATRCLEPLRKKRTEVIDLVADFETLRQHAEQVKPPVLDEFCCPLSMELMVEPVSTADGQTYERASIEAWLKHSDLSPLTMAVLEHKFLTPNLALKRLIAQAHPA